MKLKYVTIVLALFGFIALQITSCTKDKVPLAPLSSECVDTISYSAFVKPLMVANCSTSGCHDSFGAGGKTLETYSQISSFAEIILKSIRHDGVSPMPQNAPKMDDSIATQLNCWILQGKLEN
jgi:hypothetical protein